VIFGGGLSGSILIASLGSRGFEIDGAAAKDANDVFYGDSVAGAGDVNGDGRPDILVTRLNADPNGRDKAGSAYVVFGKASNSALDLAALGSQGFQIAGAAAGDTLNAAAGVGDVDGDGRPDVAVGSYTANNNARTDSGSVWVVLGKASTSTVDLASLGNQGFRIDGAATGDRLLSVAGAGDWNSNGKADVAVGSGSVGNNGRANSGSTYVVFSGSANPPPPPPGPPPPPPPPSGDKTPPTVAPRVTNVKRSAVALLFFRVSDNSGSASVEGGVYRQGNELKHLGPKKFRNGRYRFTWPSTSRPEHVRFCLTARDAAGNTSGKKCAAISVN
jgi:FG-GAP repeat